MARMSGRSSLRDRTREEIYALIDAAGEATCADLAEASGLPSSTVARAVDKLVAENVIVKAKAQAKGPGSGSGRPGNIYRLVESGRRVGAIDLGHQHIRVALANDIGETLAQAELGMDVDLNAASAMDHACELLAGLCAEQKVDRLTVVAAGIPGPVDRDASVVCSPTILSGWVGLDPAAELEKRLGTPVHVDNDAALGALGEQRRGAGRKHRDFLYLKASHGIGAGLVVNGRPYSGSVGLAGEIGHTPIAGHSELCRCGRRGCLEAVVSMDTVWNQMLHTHPGMTPDELATDGDDPVTRRLFEDAGRTLGQVLAIMVNLFNPSAVIIGGELGASGPHLIHGVRTAIDRYAQPATAAALEVLPAALGNRAELVGTIQYACQLVRRQTSTA